MIPQVKKPEFREGYEIKLGDGQEWTFPKPNWCYYPEVKDDESIELMSKVTFGPDNDRELDLIFGSDEIDPFESMKARHRLAVKLLKSNYELTNKDLRILLSENPSDKVSSDMWTEIVRVMAGLTPKHSPDG